MNYHSDDKSEILEDLKDSIQEVNRINDMTPVDRADLDDYFESIIDDMSDDIFFGDDISFEAHLIMSIYKDIIAGDADFLHADELDN